MEQYKIIKVVGDGTYGIVSKAVNVQTNELVAIKQMRKKFLSWRECKELREIKSLKKLNHPNIIKLKEVIRVVDVLYLVFEFAESNLFQLMKSHFESLDGKPFAEGEVQSLIQQTLLGISYMHKNGFFHRDLKPENLLINNSATGPIIKICDFGQAREIRSTPPYTEYIATRWYRAPECLLRSNVYSSPVDIFAIGCIMAELYLGRPLFPGSSENDQLFKICSVLGTPTAATWPEGLKLGVKIGYQFPNFVATPLSSLIPGASKEAIDLMTAMLSFNPQKRITAAEALAHPYFASLPVKEVASLEPKPARRGAPIVPKGNFGAPKKDDASLSLFEEKKHDTFETYSPDKNKDKEFFDFDLLDKKEEVLKEYGLKDACRRSPGRQDLDGSLELRAPQVRTGQGEEAGKSAHSHSVLPQSDFDYIADILNDQPIHPFDDRRELSGQAKAENPEETKSRRKNAKYLIRPNAETKKLPGWPQPGEAQGAEETKADTVKPRRLLNRKPLAIPGAEPSATLAAPLHGSDYSPSGFSEESNFSYHKRLMGGGGNLNGMVGSPGLRGRASPNVNMVGGARGNYKSDSLVPGYGEPSTTAYGAEIAQARRKSDENNLYAPYEQPQTGTVSYGSIGVNPQGANGGLMQFNYGRYKYK